MSAGATLLGIRSVSRERQIGLDGTAPRVIERNDGRQLLIRPDSIKEDPIPPDLEDSRTPSCKVLRSCFRESLYVKPL
jgi:hypothetical protein